MTQFWRGNPEFPSWFRLLPLDISLVMLIYAIWVAMWPGIFRDRLSEVQVAKIFSLILPAQVLNAEEFAVYGELRVPPLLLAQPSPTESITNPFRLSKEFNYTATTAGVVVDGTLAYTGEKFEMDYLAYVIGTGGSYTVRWVCGDNVPGPPWISPAVHRPSVVSPNTLPSECRAHVPSP